jgi:hypothetical protein
MKANAYKDEDATVVSYLILDLVGKEIGVLI